MYKYHLPKPIIIKLTDELSFQLRQKAAKYIAANQNRTGAEQGSSEEQGFGALNCYPMDGCTLLLSNNFLFTPCIDEIIKKDKIIHIDHE